MSEEEKKSQMKGDDIDEINTTDLEQEEQGPRGEESFNEISYEFLENNRINLARAFLGMDGGYSIRKLKKLMKNDRLQQQEARDE